MRRPRTWRSWLWVIVGGSLGVVVGSALVAAAALVSRGVMGGVCTDGKALGSRNAGDLPFFAGLPRVANIAHRGASALAPEHSLEAFELALAQGAHVLELDLRLTRDGVLIVAHDRTLRRTLGQDAAWAELTLDQIAAIAGGRAPPTLERVLRQFPGARFNLELKDEGLGAARALAELLAREAAGDRVLVASRHSAVLRELRRASEGAVATSASAREVLDYYSCYLMGLSCPAAYSALQLPALGALGLTSARFIAGAHARGLMVHFWTVDDAERASELVRRGADGVMTNRPDVLARVLEEAR